jgi:DNA-binding NtrC family response regulator
MKYKILLLDDEEPVHIAFERQLSRVLGESLDKIDSAFNTREAIRYIENNDYDIIFLDQRLTDGTTGSETGQKIKVALPDAYIVMATAHGLDSAQEAIRTQAFADFISKTYDNEFEGLTHVINRYNLFKNERQKRLSAERRAKEAEERSKRQDTLIRELQQPFNINIDDYVDDKSELKGNSEPMKQIRWFISLYARVELPVLLLGETGTGKEIVAKELHSNSNRRNRPFVPINCAAIPDTLIESELFGAMPGAATDIKKERKGAFERANDGVLFLDEFGDLSPMAQVKVLRAIENNEILPLGAENTKEINVRVICATSQKIIETTAQDKFRIDLFYRVGGLFPELPALRNHKVDIFDIAYFKFMDYDPIPFTPDAISFIIEYDYDWPGNVRELLHFFDHSIALFPNSRFDSTKVRMLLDLWITHQPTKNLEKALEINKHETGGHISSKHEEQTKIIEAFRSMYTKEEIWDRENRLLLISVALERLGNKPKCKIDLVLEEMHAINNKPSLLKDYGLQRIENLGASQAAFSSYFNDSETTMIIVVGLIKENIDSRYNSFKSLVTFRKLLGKIT